MRRFLMISSAAVLCVAASALAEAQQATNPIAPLVGSWDLPGTMITLKIHPDGTVDHSKLGAGTIRFDEASYYRLVFRLRNLTCQYYVRKYSDNEINFTVSVQQVGVDDCDLGTLRRSPGSEVPEAAPKGKSSSSSATGEIAGNEATKPGIPFKDCEDCPEMVVVPAGRFTMGSPNTESGRYPVEGPQHTVEVSSSFAVGRYAITRDEFEAFVKATGRPTDSGCNVEGSNQSFVPRPDLSFRSPGFRQGGSHPVVCVNWDDANDYAKWLSSKTGKHYRLLTEAEREYVTRAGSSTAYWWGETDRPDLANYYRPPHQSLVDVAPAHNAVANKASTVATVSAPPVSQDDGTVPVYEYQPNPWGLFQVHGNVGEWVEDCWNTNYTAAPTNSTAVKTGNCKRHVLRGGGWSYKASDIRSAYRESAPEEERYVHVGFRVARDLS